MIVYKDRVSETSITAGTGPLTLLGAESGYQPFSTIGNGNQTCYCIVEGNSWEVVIGTVTIGAPSTTTSRDTVLASSNAGSLVNFTTATKRVFCTQPAAAIPFREVSIDPGSPRAGESWYNTTDHAFRGSRNGVAFNIDNFRPLASDPSTPIDGETWYNTASHTFKGAKLVPSDVWSNGGSLANARLNSGGAGIQTAGLAFGGVSGGSSSTSTEAYNGSSWSAGGAMPTGIDAHGGTGTQTAAISVAGATDGVRQTGVYAYNGTTWSTGTAIGTATNNLAACGSTTATLISGGQTDSSQVLATCETYNGTTWTASGSLPTALRQESMIGISSAATLAGGYDGIDRLSTVYKYNGTSWSSAAAMSATRNARPGMFGTQDNCMVAGGQAPTGGSAVNTSELFNGTSWTSKANLTAAKAQGASGCQSSTSAGLIFGGAGDAFSEGSNAQHYSGGVTSTIVTFTTS